MASRFFYFDLGNVLVKFDHEIAVRQLSSLTGLTLEQTRAAVFESDLQERFETGKIDACGFAAEVNALCQQSAGEEEVMEAISAIFQPYEPILAVLERVQAAGIPMGILSNTCDAHWKWILRHNWPMLGDWFQHYILSYEVGCMKPYPGIYELSEQRAGLSGERLFFTDDKPENIAAAQERGWSTHLFRDAAELLDAFERWQAATA